MVVIYTLYFTWFHFITYFHSIKKILHFLTFPYDHFHLLNLIILNKYFLLRRHNHPLLWQLSLCLYSHGCDSRKPFFRTSLSVDDPQLVVGVSLPFLWPLPQNNRRPQSVKLHGESVAHKNKALATRQTDYVRKVDGSREIKDMEADWYHVTLSHH